MSMWAELPSELLQVIAEKHTNYVDYLFTRAVCKSWQKAIAKRPHNLLCQLPFLLLPYHQDIPDHRGFYNIPNDITYSLQLPEAFEKRCCGSSHGWLIMVEDSPSIFLLNPLKRARIELPSLSSFPTFPTDLVFENSQNLNEDFIIREKLHIRDTFIVKAILSTDPSSATDFIVVVIYGFNENLAFFRSGDTAWSVVDEASQTSRYKDVQFRQGKLYAVDQMGGISVFSVENNTMIRVADPPPISPRTGFKQWNYGILDYGYQTRRFMIYKLDVSKSICDFPWEGHDFGIFDFDDGIVRPMGLPSYPIKLPRFPIIYRSKRSLENENDSDLRSESKDSSIVPFFDNPTLSKDAAMGLVLSAASVRGWTTGSGMEGPPVPAGADEGSNTEKVSTLPWSLFTKSPRRRMRVAFTCNVCGQRTTRAINPHAYTDGTVFVQLVDNLNLFHEMKCYVNPSFNYKDAKWDVGFKLFDMDDEDNRNDSFPI
ncbi:hypothetical protein GH714_016570 [Hevea brasiliensis]|uniref:DNL-type domain-containing protein n=1 Tax=Hevea brasiliensis TaxID=3981 RepID=A0A6A6NHZ1_HEVBR|nr:hypothetical protein GH714_016570 [Hevea brasiliensis]